MWTYVPCLLKVEQAQKSKKNLQQALAFVFLKKSAL